MILGTEKHRVELRGAPEAFLDLVLNYSGPPLRREIICASAGGTGKSRGFLQAIAYLCQEYPGLRVLLTRATRESMTSSTLVEWEECFQEGHAILDGPQREGRSIYRFPNGSEVAVIGLDKPGKLFSTKWDIVYAEELTGDGTANSDIPLRTWGLFYRGLRGRNPVHGQHLLVGTCNPSYPGHWVKKRIDAKKCISLESRHEDNPTLHDGTRALSGGYSQHGWTPEGRSYLNGLEQIPSQHDRDRLRWGRWTAATGRVYDCWDEDKHVVTARVWSQRGQVFVQPISDPEPTFIAWTFASYDWGWTDPAVLQVWGVDESRRLWRLAEIYKSEAGKGTERMGLDWWADRVAEFYSEFDLRALVYDPSRAETGEKFNRRISLESGKDVPGFALKADNKHGTAQDFGGIDMMRTLLARRVEERPQMLFVRHALRFGPDRRMLDKNRPTCTEEELPAYVYEEPREGRPNQDKPAEGQADHGCDAARYAAAYFWSRDMAESSKRILCPRGSVGWHSTWPGGQSFTDWWEAQSA